MKTFELYAEALSYPYPGLIQVLQSGLEELDDGDTRQALGGFLNQIQNLTLARWEELYTRTWDLDPLAVPYLGYQIWGDSYPRGNFMALMSAELKKAGLSPEGELPDHLVQVLRYLSTTTQPAPELLAILEPALQKILGSLKRAEPDNPYRFLLEGVWQSSKALV